MSILLGAAYGLLGLEVASPLALAMFLLVIALPVIVWRLHVSTTVLLILVGAVIAIRQAALEESSLELSEPLGPELRDLREIRLCEMNSSQVR
jgi:predicted membrane chloride channel (bestrophin family)